jgi:RimJ/RimL family protein N-acetyltransferase
VPGESSPSEEHRRHGFGLCATFERGGKVLIGRCGLEPREAGAGLEGDLAWMFHREHWGRGLGTEVARELIRFGLEDLGLHRVFATANLENERSIRIMKRVGMRFVLETPHGVQYEVRAGALP